MISCNDKLCHRRNDNTNNINLIHPGQVKPKKIKLNKKKSSEV